MRWKALLHVSVWRGTEQGRYVDYEVPRQTSQTVLDVVTYIQRKLDSTLAYRYACRVGMCGSCAMTVNGVARWTCRTHVSAVAGEGSRLQIAPLANLPVIRDLATDMREFFDKWARAKGQYQSTRTRHDEFAAVAPQSRHAQARDAGIECIGCGSVLRVLRCSELAARVSRPCRTEPRMDVEQRRARRRRTASVCARSPATLAATAATRTSAAPSVARNTFRRQRRLRA